jgi:hypothetical protein
MCGVMMQGFELTKWYADCVSENGEVAIVYNAELRWRSVTIHYNSLLIKRAGRPAQTVYSMRNWPAPAVHDNEIEWAAPDWEAAGNWREPGHSQRNILFQSDAGSLDWHCVAPRAAATMQIESRLKIDGWGYVEHLRLTLVPWKLPIRRLRWGRFVNATDALVWIDWSGAYNKRAVYLNGSEVKAMEISDSEVAIEESGAVLTLDRDCVLREGELGSTALKVIPNVERLFQSSILNMRECKWLSGAVLHRPGQADSVGMAIHEVVEWP